MLLEVNSRQWPCGNWDLELKVISETTLYGRISVYIPWVGFFHMFHDLCWSCCDEGIINFVNDLINFYYCNLCCR